MAPDGKSRSRSLIIFTHSRNNFIDQFIWNRRTCMFLAKYTKYLSKGDVESFSHSFHSTIKKKKVERGMKLGRRDNTCVCGHVRQGSIFLLDIVSEREKFQLDIETFWPDIVRCPTTISGPDIVNQIIMSDI